MCSQNLENQTQKMVMSDSENLHSETISLPDDAEEDIRHEPEEITSEKKKHKDSFSAGFDSFKTSFDQESDPGVKLESALAFMESFLAEKGTTHFRSFWEVRRLCIPLFKENIPLAHRNHLWTKYSELSKEARRLKDLLDEQSSFAVEQIQIAVEALEKEISLFDDLVEKSLFPDEIIFPKTLQDHCESYKSLQKQLAILNAQASRINSLRKELLKTEMRVRNKNKFFQQLSLAGDHVFPKRKELIKQVSEQFSGDVDQFIEKYFGEQPAHETFFILKDEIKLLQGLAKILTLNTQSFTQTRTRLSECWDRIKVEEKERKKERTQQKVVHKHNLDEISKEILDLKAALEANEMNEVAGQKKVEEIIAHMRRVDLGRDELKILRDSLGGVRAILSEKIKAAGEARQNLEREKEREKREKYLAVLENARHLIDKNESLTPDQLIGERDALMEKIQLANLSKSEKLEIERMLKPLRDIIADKKEQALLDLSEDDRQAFQQLKAILQQRKERRQEIKDQLEQLRKAAGSSSLDFEKAMNYNTQINEEKERLERANQAIEEIERKIKEWG